MRVARILEGTVTPLGQGIVAHPAADVKTIAPIISPDVAITPSVASVDNNITKELKIMKIKLSDSVIQDVAAKLALHEKSTGEYAPASITLNNGEVINDVKLYGNDYIEVTYNGDIEGDAIKEVTICLPLVQIQNITRRACDVKDAEELTKMIENIMETLKVVKERI